MRCIKGYLLVKLSQKFPNAQNPMQELKELILSLSATERKAIKNLMAVKGGQKCQKRLQLFDLISQKPSISSENAANYIYGSKPNSAFSQLKRRLKEELLEMLPVCSEINLDPYSKNEQECARILQQSYQLIHRGLHNQASRLLDRLQGIAQKYEFWDYCNLAAQYKDYSKETTENILSKYIGTEKIATIDAEKLLENPEGHLLQSPSKRRDLLLILQLLEDKLESRTAGYLIAVIERIRKVMRKVPAISKPVYMKASSQLIAKAYMLQGNYRSALEHLEQVYSETGPQACHSLFETLFIARLKLGQYDEALKLLTRWESQDTAMNALNKRSYYKACMNFKHQDYKSVIKELNASQKSYSAMSTSLTFWGRILELMALLEMEEIDWAEYRLEALRKFFFNHELNHYSHFNAAFNVFKSIFSFLHQRLNPKKIFHSNPSDLNLADYKPDIFNYEVIDWYQWTRSRIAVEQ